jgi:DNA-binding MarR family transcriptional regulator
MKEREHRLGRQFGLLTKLYFGVINKRLEKLDIDRSFFVLITINESNANCTQQYIADTLQVDKVSMVKTLDYLSEMGYTVRQRNKTDRRKINVRLTAKAKKNMKLIYDTLEETYKDATSGLTKEQKEEFFAAIEIIARNLNRMPSKKITLRVKSAK